MRLAAGTRLSSVHANASGHLVRAIPIQGVSVVDRDCPVRPVSVSDSSPDGASRVLEVSPRKIPQLSIEIEAMARQVG